MLRGISITTKYVGPTNHRPARIKATCYRGSILVPFDRGGSVEGAHRIACQALLAKYWPAGPQQILAYGDDPTGTGYAYLASFPQGA